MDVAPDWESYEFKSINLDNGDDKAFFEAALAWDLEIDGKKWIDGKNVSDYPCNLVTMATDHRCLCISSSKFSPSLPSSASFIFLRSFDIVVIWYRSLKVIGFGPLVVLG